MLIKGFILLLFVGILCIYVFLIKSIKYKHILFVLFVGIHLVILCWFTLFRNDINKTLTNYFIPFSSFWQITQVRWLGSGEYLYRAIVGNVVLFVPIGILTVVSQKGNYLFLISGIIGLSVSLAIEVLQLTCSLGFFETDDLITNTWGAIIGCSMAFVILNRKEMSSKARVVYLLPFFLFVTIISAISLVPIFKEILRSMELI